MPRTCPFPAVLAAAALGTAAPGSDPALVDRVLGELNGHPTVKASDDSKSYSILFDAALDLTPPPLEVGPDFNLATIHPAMGEWSSVSGWAESNLALADAVIAARHKTIVGLPYGRDAVPARYRDAGIMVEIAADGNLRDNRFPYLQTLDAISAFATAEVYRRMETGQVHEGLELAIAHIFVLRQFCDREFLVEKTHAITMLATAMANLRDAFYAYQSKISAGQFTEIARREIPYLRPDRNRLFIPEADRIVSEALIEDVFDAATGNPDPELFARTFAGIQSADAPLTRFGAARRWKMISEVHSSLDASKERLELVYDDWWRRWRVQEYDDILSIPTWFDRTNVVRYAAVIHSVQDIESLFALRNRLVAEVNGTAMAAALCAYKRDYGNYPRDSDMTYSQFVRRASDRDPFDREFGNLRYRLVETREAIDTEHGRVWIERGDCILYSRGQDLEAQRGTEHTEDGLTGDIVIWPPMRAYAREQGLLD